MTKRTRPGQPPLFDNVAELEEKVESYKAYLELTGKPPTIAGLAYYTGLDRKTIYNYEKKDEFFHAIKRFRDWVMMNYEELAIEKGNGGIVFLLKNYGYNDKQEIEHSGEIGVSILDDIT